MSVIVTEGLTKEYGRAVRALVDLSIEIRPDPLTDAILNEYALGVPTCGCPSTTAERGRDAARIDQQQEVHRLPHV